MAGFNISSFFGRSSFGGFSSIDFSQYNMIRSGSYRKLMQSYYSQPKNNTETVKSNNNKWNTNVKDTSGLSDIRKQAVSLKNSADALKSSDVFAKKDGEYDTEKITSAVKDFVKNYNSTIDKAKQTDSREVSQQTSFMMSMTNTMSNALSKVGITVDKDGKMSLDEEAFKNADMNTAKSLFSGSYSYASSIAGKASAIGSAALRSTGAYTSTGLYSNTGYMRNSSYSSAYNYWR